jgi:hypothetical protein
MIEYKLQYPITFGSETITTLKLRQLKLKHLKKVDEVNGDISKTAKLIELMADIPPPVVDEISPKDVTEIGKIIESFF